MAEYSNIYHVGEVAGKMNAKKVAKDLLGVPGMKGNKKSVNKLAAKIRALNGLKKGETFDAFTGSNKAIAAGEKIPSMGYGYALKLPNYQGRQYEMALGGPSSYIDQYGTFRKSPSAAPKAAGAVGQPAGGGNPFRQAQLAAMSRFRNNSSYNRWNSRNDSDNLDEWLRLMGLL